MPMGSIHIQHIASMARPNSSTPQVAATLNAWAPRAPRWSVSMVTAKSMRSLVNPVDRHAGVARDHVEQDQQHQQRHEGGEQVPLHAQNLRGQRQHPADGSARRRRLRGGWTVGRGHDGVPGEEGAAMKEKALYFLISNKYI